ncbi:MAG: diacylglycerol kinase family protein [Clostridia bacterium]|nr:diacylglycerol kinase family protein [Clostridia bacterium]
MEEYKKLFKSFFYAFRGIENYIKNERNMRIHLVCCIYMYSILIFSGWWTLSAVQWALIFIGSAVVLAGELVNTAVENTVDMFTNEKNEYARRAKDAAAGAVLVSAIFAVLTGIAVLWQPQAFNAMFGYFKTHILSLAVFVISLAPATLFIFFGFGNSENKK